MKIAKWLRDRWFWVKWFSTVCAFLFCVGSVSAQGTVSGNETTITYSGSNIPIVPPNTSASQFNSPSGLNTFIFSLPNPTVSIRVYITNNTANACNGAFTAQVFSATDPQVSSFNNSPSNWQLVPLQNAASQLVGSLSLAIPASGAIYFSTAVISSPRAVLQLVNATNSCATTNLEVTAVVSNIALTSPLISVNSATNFSSGAGNVQGVVAQQASAAGVFPLINGGVQPAINGNFLAVGVDNFNLTRIQENAGASGTFAEGIVPSPSATNEVAIALNMSFPDGASTALLAPWVCQPATGNSACTGGQISVATLNSPIAGTLLNRTHQNVITGGSNPTSIILSTSPATTFRQGHTGTTSIVFSSNTAAGSTLMLAEACSGICTIATVTDTQGNNWQPLISSATSSSYFVYVSTTLSTAAAETITVTTATGSLNVGMGVELTGTTPSQLVTPAISSSLDQLGQQVVRLDAQSPNQFNCNVPISTATTTQCQPAATTINGTPVRFYITDIQVNTTTAGAGSTLQLVQGTGANCATNQTNLSAITYSGAAVALQNFLGMRTPLVAVSQSAVCVKQVGATPSTSVVEVHGFTAP